MSGWLFGPSAPNKAVRRALMRSSGPILELVIAAEPGRNSAPNVPDTFACGALIDTGASHCAIDYRIAHARQLRQIDARSITTPNGASRVGVFPARLLVPGLGYDDLILVMAAKIDHLRYKALRERDFLQPFEVTFDWPAGMFHVQLGDQSFAQPDEE